MEIFLVYLLPVVTGWSLVVGSYLLAERSGWR